jgi:hypothetical protein
MADGMSLSSGTAARGLIVEKVLVAYATGRVGTGEIALTIAEQLTRSGLAVDLRPCTRARPAADYAAVVLGSASEPTWEQQAIGYLAENLYDLAPARTRLFTWQPVTSTASPDERLLALLETAGLHDPTPLRAPARPWRPGTFLRHGSAPTHWLDRVDWENIRGWAQRLAADLEEQVASSPAGRGPIRSLPSS